MAVSIVLSCLLLWSFLSDITAFDITKILNQYSDYSIFSQELSKSNVAREINKRKSITVLVVPNGATFGLIGLQDDSLSTIMKIHVILDYYDSAKIKKLKDGTRVTTLYQTTGSADNNEGFIQVHKENNEIKLGLAVSGGQMSARLNKVVTSMESDISVIEISSPILPPGIHSSTTASHSSKSPGSSPSPSPSKSHKSKSSSSSSSPSPSKSHKSKSPSSSSSPNPSKSHKSKPPSSSSSPSPSKSHKSNARSPDSSSDNSPSKGQSDPPSNSSDLDSDSPAPAPSPAHKKKNKHKHSHAPAPSDDDNGDDADADADANDDDYDADADVDEEDDTEEDDDKSSCSRNTVVSSGILLASLFATLYF